MNEIPYGGKILLTLSVIRAAQAGDAQAINKILEHYQGYINRLCTRRLRDENGNYHAQVDEFMKSRLENKLIRSIVMM